MYKEVGRPVLDFLESSGILPANKAHGLVRALFHIADSHPFLLGTFEKMAAHHGKRFSDTRLHTTLGTMEMDNPVMIGAGWDKEGKTVNAFGALGAGAIAIGGVLLLNQQGNPGATEAMLSKGVAWNWIGLKSPGVAAVVKNLERYKDDHIPILANIAVNKDVPLNLAPEAFALTVHALYPFSSGFEFNFSCPNTDGHEICKDLPLIDKVIAASVETMERSGGYKSSFLKISPDWDDDLTNQYIDLVHKYHLTGITAVNTTANCKIKAKYGKPWAVEKGGLSGNDPEYQTIALSRTAYIRERVGKEFMIIGSGGICSPETAWERIKAGANAIQIVTGMRVGAGTALIGMINEYFVKQMEKEGKNNLQEFVGSGRLAQTSCDFNP